MSNYRKLNTSTFTTEERVQFVSRCTAKYKNVEVDSYMGLLADYARKKGACAVVKGLRAVSDFEDEFQQALTNKKLNSDVETVFMAASVEHMFLSSSMIKQICLLGGDAKQFLPNEISDEVTKRILIAEKEKFSALK